MMCWFSTDKKKLLCLSPLKSWTNSSNPMEMLSTFCWNIDCIVFVIAFELAANPRLRRDYTSSLPSRVSDMSKSILSNKHFANFMAFCLSSNSVPFRVAIHFRVYISAALYSATLLFMILCRSSMLPSASSWRGPLLPADCALYCLRLLLRRLCPYSIKLSCTCIP